jgi:hypothetical protein
MAGAAARRANRIRREGSNPKAVPKPPTPWTFRFLKSTNPLLAEYAVDATRLARTRPADSLVNSRKFAEYLALHIAKVEGIKFELDNEGNEDNSFASLLNLLASRNILRDRDVIEAFNEIRKNGNRGAHPPKTALSNEEIRDYKARLSKEALSQLHRAQHIAFWFRTTRYCKLSLLQRLGGLFIRKR